MSEIKELNSENFKTETESGTVLIDFWAEWCGPCRMIGPIIDEIAEEMGDKIAVGKVNVDENQELAAEYKVRSIPAIFILKDGEVVDSFVGVTDKDSILEALKKAV